MILRLDVSVADHLKTLINRQLCGNSKIVKRKFSTVQHDIEARYVVCRRAMALPKPRVKTDGNARCRIEGHNRHIPVPFVTGFLEFGRH